MIELENPAVDPRAGSWVFDCIEETAASVMGAAVFIC